VRRETYASHTSKNTPTPNHVAQNNLRAPVKSVDPESKEDYITGNEWAFDISPARAAKMIVNTHHKRGLAEQLKEFDGRGRICDN